MYLLTLMVADCLHIDRVITFAVHEVWLIFVRGCYSHMSTIDTTNGTRKSTNTKKTLLYFVSFSSR